MRSERESTVGGTVQPRSVSRTVTASGDAMTAAGPEGGTAARAARMTAAVPAAVTAVLSGTGTRFKIVATC
jgi:hypothetical protein